MKGCYVGNGGGELVRAICFQTLQKRPTTILRVRNRFLTSIFKETQHFLFVPKLMRNADLFFNSTAARTSFILKKISCDQIIFCLQKKKKKKKRFIEGRLLTTVTEFSLMNKQCTIHSRVAGSSVGPKVHTQMCIK